MHKYFLFLAIIFLATSCAPAKKRLKVLSHSEIKEIKLAKKQWHKKSDAYRAIIITDSGSMVIRLYNETPLHRDNFVKKVKAGFYDSLLFHRIIKNFMIQGGDPNSKHAKPNEPLGNGEAPGGTIPAEIHTDLGLYHKKGVIAAARDENPEKASSNCQFYIAQGRIFTLQSLQDAANKRGYTINNEQIKHYTSVGGIPHLDNRYTVYGELESGLEVLDKLAAVPTNTGDRPIQDLRMFIFLISSLKNNMTASAF